MSFRFCCWLVLIRYFPACANSSDASICEEWQQDIRRLVSVGSLSSARWVALTSLSQARECKDVIAKTYRIETDWRFHQDESNYLRQIEESFDPLTALKPMAQQDAADCQISTDETDKASIHWDECCSILPKLDTVMSEGRKPLLFTYNLTLVKSDHPLGRDACSFRNQCCEFFSGSQSHLRLPALQEPAVRVRISVGTDVTKPKVLALEQDGFLRPFDVAGILWPSGYLLSLCVSNPILQCQAPELQRALDSLGGTIREPGIIELGTGIGAPSISMSLYLHQDRRLDVPAVVATDIAPQALALATVNAKANGVTMTIARVNHTNLDSLQSIKQTYSKRGFAVVLGSSLQSLFLDTEDPDGQLWKVLGILLADDNPFAIAVLVHTRSEPLQEPRDQSFKLVRKISGDHFGMKTRSGDVSDFEICLFQRNLYAYKEEF